MQKGNIAIVFLTVILVLLLAGLGAYYYSIKKPVIAPALEKNVATSSATPGAETSNWKTYTYPELNVSFKLPPDWKVESNDSFPQLDWGIIPMSSKMLTIKHSGSDSYRFFYYENPKNLTIKQFETENQKEPPPDSLGTGMGISPGVYDSEAKEITIAGVKAYYGKTFCEPAMCTIFIIPYNKRIYVLNTGSSTEGELNDKLQKILDTFTFLDQLTPGNSPDPVTGRFCGGIAANLPQNKCPPGYFCSLDGNYPDASGKCVREKSD